MRTGQSKVALVSFVNANFSLSAIVAQLMPSSMSASVAPPCT
jgi:hypothetical protein